MDRIEDYASREKITALAEKINLPEEPVNAALKYIENGEYKKAGPYFGGLFSAETAADSANAAAKLFNGKDGKPADSGFGLMAVFLIAAMKTKEIYDERGIGEDVYLETMSFFNEILNENLVFYGKYVFDRQWWYYRQIACLIFKLGALEYEFKTINAKDEKFYGLPEGVNTLSVHIQTGALLTRETLDDSYERAGVFFNEFFPAFDFKHFTCCSWLLAPALTDLLPAGSRIAEFRSDYDIKHAFTDNEQFFGYVYKIKQKPEDLNSLPEDTSLRRAVKKHLLAGGKIGEATGVKKSVAERP